MRCLSNQEGLIVSTLSLQSSTNLTLGKGSSVRFHDEAAARKRRAMLTMARWLLLIVGLTLAEEDSDLRSSAVQHSARQCGEYLCPAFPKAAEKFISGGCEGDFAAFAAQMGSDGNDIGSVFASGLSSTALVRRAPLLAAPHQFLFRLLSQLRPHSPLSWSASLQVPGNKHANEAIFQSELPLITSTASLITYVSYLNVETLSENSYEQVTRQEYHSRF